jgi:uncharacterized protein (DUF4415 family)
MKKQYDFSKARKGKKSKELKVIKTFRMDPEVIEWLEVEGEKQGMGYQTYLNWFLRKTMESSESIEDRLDKLEEMILRKKA